MSNAPTPLLTISAFARAVGLAPSTLRYYDEAGLLPPAEVDPQTGYRYYTPHLERRALLIGRLREVGAPVELMRAVLDGPALESGVVGPVSGYTNGVGMVNGQTPMNVLAGDVFTLEIAALPGPSGALTGVTFTIDFQPIPEPSSCALAGICLVGLLACARRRSSRR